MRWNPEMFASPRDTARKLPSQPEGKDEEKKPSSEVEKPSSEDEDMPSPAEEENKELRNEVNILQSELIVAQNEVDKERSNAERLLKIISDQSNECEELKSKLNRDLEQAKNEYAVELRDLRAANKRIQTENKHQAAELRELKTNYKRVREESKHQCEELEELRSRHKRVQEDAKHHTSELRELRLTHKRTKEEAKQQYEELEGLKAKLRRNHDENRHTQLLEELKELKSSHEQVLEENRQQSEELQVLRINYERVEEELQRSLREATPGSKTNMMTTMMDGFSSFTTGSTCIASTSLASSASYPYPPAQKINKDECGGQEYGLDYEFPEIFSPSNDMDDFLDSCQLALERRRERNRQVMMLRDEIRLKIAAMKLNAAAVF